MQGGKGALHFVGSQPTLDHGGDPGLVDRLRARWVELLADRILRVAEDEDDLARLARGEREPDVVGAHRRPAVRDRVEGAAPFHRLRRVPAPAATEEDVTLGVEAGERLGAREVCEMVASLPVLGLVVDDAVDDLDLAH